MNDDFGEGDPKLESEQPQLLSSNKDRVRGPQGRRLPQRKSMMPMGSPSEEGVKPRSFSLSSPKEAEEEGDDENGESTPREQKRISLSMEAVHREGMALDDSCQRSCSSSDHLSPPSSEAAPAKKPVFGRLGGQHAALTKELELKLKSGLVPGGRKFHPHRAEEEPVVKSRSDSEADELEKKIDGISSTLSSVQCFMQNLEEKFKTLKESTIDEMNVLVQDFITETSTTLKEIQTHSAQCKEALAEVHHIRDEHRRLVHQCQEALQQLRTTQNSSQLGEKADS